MDYSKWEEKTPVVTSLRLDLRNPRIPPSKNPLKQRELLAELVNHDNVFDLARSIVVNGYFPTELLIVVREDSKLVVVEGNRRLAALKLLIAPETAPENFKPRFSSLSARVDKATIKKVKVVIAPSREAAAPIIMSRHTIRQIDGWDTINQASYYSGLLNDGMTIDDLTTQYGIKKSDIIELIRLQDMYRIACSLELPEDAALLVNNPRDFPATTLKRFYESSVGQNFLGIELSSDSPSIKGIVDKSEFRKGFRRIVLDIVEKNINSRSINSNKLIERYIQDIKDETPLDVPNLSKKGTFDANEIVNKSDTSISEPINTRKTVTPKPKKLSIGIIPTKFPCEVNNQKIQNIVAELKHLPVGKYPNGTALLLRSLLEVSLSDYLEKTGDLYKIINDENERRNKSKRPLKPNWHPSLKIMLSHITSEKCSLIQNPNFKSSLRKFSNNKDELLSHDDLNYFVHNQYYLPNSESLRGYWLQLEELFKITLTQTDTEEIE